MAELIDREELRKFPIRIDHYDKENGSLDFVLGIETVFEHIEYLPTIDAKPVVHAHWISEDEAERLGHFEWSYCCSNCKEIFWDCTESFAFSYCPCCGAQMDEKESD